jgi:hypothetical protein
MTERMRIRNWTIERVTWRDRFVFDVVFLDRWKVLDEGGQIMYSDPRRSRCEWWIRLARRANYPYI